MNKRVTMVTALLMTGTLTMLAPTSHADDCFPNQTTQIVCADGWWKLSGTSSTTILAYIHVVGWGSVSGTVSGNGIPGCNFEGGTSGCSADVYIRQFTCDGIGTRSTGLGVASSITPLGAAHHEIPSKTFNC